MSEIITRDIIADYMKFNYATKDELCLLINRWKRLLVTKCSVKRSEEHTSELQSH